MNLPPPNQQPPQWQAPTPTGQQVATQWVPPTPGPAAKSGLGPHDHFKRAAIWRLERVVATPSESAALAAVGITDAAVQGYAAWRRSALLVAAPVVALTAVLAVVGFKDVETDDPITELGVLAQVFPLLGPVALAIGVAVAIKNWIGVKQASPRAADRVGALGGAPAGSSADAHRLATRSRLVGSDGGRRRCRRRCPPRAEQDGTGGGIPGTTSYSVVAFLVHFSWLLISSALNR